MASVYLSKPPNHRQLLTNLAVQEVVLAQNRNPITRSQGLMAHLSYLRFAKLSEIIGPVPAPVGDGGNLRAIEFWYF